VKDDSLSYNNGAHVNPGLASLSSTDNLHEECHYSGIQNHGVNFEVS
jgi:hypothetical protein